MYLSSAKVYPTKEMRSMAIATVPTSDAEVFQNYFALIKWHVVRAKISEDAVEDYAMTLMERFIQHGLLAQYDPSKANFRTFLSGFVTSYLRHFKAQDLKRKERFALSTEFTVGEKDHETLILDLKGYSAPDQFDDAEVSFSIQKIREKIEASGDAKLLLFFEIVLLQVEEYGQMDVAELAELFGVTRSSIHNWRKKLRTYFEETM